MSPPPACRLRPPAADALVQAAARGDLRRTHAMLRSRGMHPNLVAPSGATPLFAAAECGAGAMVQLLLRRGANPLQRVHGSLPLHIAAATGHAACMAALLHAAPASIDVADPRGYTALHVASLNGRANVVRGLMQAGADTDRDTFDGFDAVHLAAIGGSADTLRALLMPWSDADFLDAQGCTPLHHAIVSNSVAAVQVLLQADADPNTPCNGLPPLHLAVSHGHAAVIPALLAAGAATTARDASGHTALQLSWAAYETARSSGQHADEAALWPVVAALSWPGVSRFMYRARAALSW